MESNFLKSKYRLLVLLDQPNSSHTALKNAVNLAKMVDASIEVFHVKLPTQVVRFDNQIAVMRELVEERAKTKKTMQRLVDTITDEEKIPIKYNFTFGNVINEVQKHIDKTQPDIVVVGKRKAKLVNFLGDGLTSHLLKNHRGGILISGNEGKPTSNDSISIGFLDDVLTKTKSPIAEDLKKCTDRPLKLFKINRADSKPIERIPFSKTKEYALLPNTIIFEFDNGMDISNSISKYIEKSKVGLLFVKRSKLLNFGNSLKTITSQFQKTINKTNIPVLILEK